VGRGRDFHVDLYGSDGTKTSAEKIPFDWQRLTDSLKAFVLDSAKQVMEKQRADRMAMLDSTRKLTGNRTQINAGPPGGGAGGGAQVFIMMRSGDGGGAPPPRGSSTPQFTMPPLQFVQPYELPDYRPAFGPGAAKCDANGNLWVRTSQANDGRSIYDVISSKGALIDRVEL